MPSLVVWLAALTEAAGAVLPALGLTTRWITVPLTITMIVTAVTVHVENGWLTGSSEFVILNNGIVFAATYLIMLLALFFLDGGKSLSADHWTAIRFRD